MNEKVAFKKAVVGFYLNERSGEIEAIIISRYEPTGYDIINMVRRGLETSEIVDILGKLIEPKHVYQELVKMFISGNSQLLRYVEDLVFVSPSEKNALIQAYKSYLFSSSLNDRRTQVFLNGLFIQSGTMLRYSEWLRDFDEQSLPFATLLQRCAHYSKQVPMELINE